METQNKVRVVFGNQSYLEDKKLITRKKWLRGFLERSGCQDDIKKIQDKSYSQKKAELRNKYPQLNLSLNMVPDDFLSGLETYLAPSECIRSEPENIGEKRRKIKRKNLKIRLRYEKLGKPKNFDNDVEVKAEPSKSTSNFRVRGCPKGKRKTYMYSLINKDLEPGTESESSSFDSDQELPALSLPEL